MSRLGPSVCGCSINSCDRPAQSTNIYNKTHTQLTAMNKTIQYIKKKKWETLKVHNLKGKNTFFIIKIKKYFSFKYWYCNKISYSKQAKVKFTSSIIAKTKMSSTGKHWKSSHSHIMSDDWWVPIQK